MRTRSPPRRSGSSARPAAARGGRTGGRACRRGNHETAQSMSIDIANESGAAVDEADLAGVARFALDQMRIHPLAELSVLIVDERTMTELHERWMGEPGPTDVLSFPMDELRPPHLAGGHAGPGRGGGARTRACSATWCSARRSRPPRPVRPGTALRPSWSC